LFKRLGAEMLNAINSRKFKLRHCQQVEELDLSVQAGAFVFINSER